MEEEPELAATKQAAVPEVDLNGKLPQIHLAAVKQAAVPEVDRNGKLPRTRPMKESPRMFSCPENRQK